MPTERQICKSPKVNRLLSMASVSLECPLLSDATPRYTPHSHSIVPSDDKALIYQRNFFAARQRTVSPIRQKFALLIPKTSFGDPRFARFQRLSASIGRFSHLAASQAAAALLNKDRHEATYHGGPSRDGHRTSRSAPGRYRYSVLGRRQGKTDPRPDRPESSRSWVALLGHRGCEREHGVEKFLPIRCWLEMHIV
jgi:hypothetical protein